MLALALIAALAQQAKPKVVVVDHDDVVVRESCTIDASAAFVLDANGDGVLHVVGDDLVIDFIRSQLFGAAPGTQPDAFSGIGITVQGKNVTLRGAIVGGFKAGIVAHGCDGLVLESCDVSNNFHQRLKSTPEREDESDWLYPHNNDHDEWLTNYGAGIYVTDSNNVTLRMNTARHGQNGICLRRVSDSKVYDNDMSWMSGWGLALYRCSKNVVSHNSFDFCIRGYSHGVYARGQDSAGILCFEQSSDNVFAYNSATHGGDGFFGFAGNEALESRAEHDGGCCRNLLSGNDFSYAAAIGIEMTFSESNVFEKNRLAGSNYGVWGGYSSSTWILGNEIDANTISGIAIEHGSDWRIERNRFSDNARAIELWWDDDKDLLAKPWAKTHPTDSKIYVIQGNAFTRETVPLELRATKDVVWNADQNAERSTWHVDAASEVRLGTSGGAMAYPSVPLAEFGKRDAVGALKQFDGRDKIIVTEWGPYDWKAPLLQRIEDRGNSHAWRLLGEEVPIGVDAGRDVRTKLDVSVTPPVITVSPRKEGVATPYELVVQVPSKAKLTGKALLLNAPWKIGVFAYTADPREKLDDWHTESKSAHWFTSSRLDLAYGNAGPSELPNVPKEIADAKLPKDHFGTLASTSVVLPKGRWRVTSNSDDGVRVWIGDKLAIDDWTWHVPTQDTAEFDSDGEAPTALRVEHFELDGYSVLEVELAQVETKPATSR